MLLKTATSEAFDRMESLRRLTSSLVDHSRLNLSSASTPVPAASATGSLSSSSSSSASTSSASSVVSSLKQKFLDGYSTAQNAAFAHAHGHAVGSGGGGSGGGSGSDWGSLDVTLLADRLLVVGFPVNGPTKRKHNQNNVDELAAFLDAKHGEHFLFFNLNNLVDDTVSQQHQSTTSASTTSHGKPEPCANPLSPSYSDGCFHNGGKNSTHHRTIPDRLHLQMLDFNWERDGMKAHTPSLDLMFRICYAIFAWLTLDANNIALVNCQTGKTRSGVVLACYLLFARLADDSMQAFLEFYLKRWDMKNLSIRALKDRTPPSIQRFLSYFHSLVENQKAPNEKPLVLKAMICRTLPVDTKPCIQMWDDHRLVFSSSEASLRGTSTTASSMKQYGRSQQQQEIPEVEWNAEEGFLAIVWERGVELDGGFSFLCSFGDAYDTSMDENCADVSSKILFRYADSTWFISPGLLTLTKNHLDMMKQYEFGFDDENFSIDLVFGESPKPRKSYVPIGYTGNTAVKQGIIEISKHHFVLPDPAVHSSLVRMGFHETATTFALQRALNQHDNALALLQSEGLQACFGVVRELSRSNEAKNCSPELVVVPSRRHSTAEVVALQSQSGRQFGSFHDASVICGNCKDDDFMKRAQLVKCNGSCGRSFHTTCVGLKKIPFGLATMSDRTNHAAYVKKYFSKWECDNCSPRSPTREREISPCHSPQPTKAVPSSPSSASLDTSTSTFPTLSPVYAPTAPPAAVSFVPSQLVVNPCTSSEASQVDLAGPTTTAQPDSKRDSIERLREFLATNGVSVDDLLRAAMSPNISIAPRTPNPSMSNNTQSGDVSSASASSITASTASISGTDATTPVMVDIQSSKGERPATTDPLNTSQTPVTSSSIPSEPLTKLQPSTSRSRLLDELKHRSGQKRHDIQDINESTINHTMKDMSSGSQTLVELTANTSKSLVVRTSEDSARLSSVQCETVPETTRPSVLCPSTSRSRLLDELKLRGGQKRQETQEMNPFAVTDSVKDSTSGSQILVETVANSSKCPVIKTREDVAHSPLVPSEMKKSPVPETRPNLSCLGFSRSRLLDELKHRGGQKRPEKCDENTSGSQIPAARARQELPSSTRDQKVIRRENLSEPTINDAVKDVVTMTQGDAISSSTKDQTVLNRPDVNLTDPDNVSSKSQILSTQDETVPNNNDPSSANTKDVLLKQHEQYGMYFKMLSMGIPEGAVRHKMQNDSADVRALDLGPDASYSKLVELINGDTSQVMLKDHPEFAQYFKMLQLGIPEGAVHHKMIKDGVNTKALELGPNAPYSRLLETTRKVSEGDSGKNSSKAKALRRRKKLHWQPISEDRLSTINQQTIWEEKDDETLELEMDMDEFESLFFASNDSSTGKRKNSGHRLKRKQSITLIDGKRAMNAAIALARFKLTYAEIAQVVATLDSQRLTLDQLKIISDYLPTREEVGLVRGFTGDCQLLGEAEKFFLEISLVPRFESRAQCLIYQLSFEGHIEELMNSVNSVTKACEEVRSSRLLRILLSIVLKLGNTLNGESDSNAIRGFTVDSLLRLSQTKAFNQKTTVLHYLVGLVKKNHPQVLDFSQEVTSVSLASRESFESMESEMIKLEQGLGLLQRERELLLQDNDQNQQHMDQQIDKALAKSIAQFEQELTKAQQVIQEAKGQVRGVLDYFGEDPQKNATEFFLSLASFCSTFQVARKEVDAADQARERQERMKLRRAVSMAPMGSSSSNEMLVMPREQRARTEHRPKEPKHMSSSRF